MQIRPAELSAIRAGTLDLAFRRWDRPRLLVGTRMRTSIGLVEVTSVDEVALQQITEQDAKRAGSASYVELLRQLAYRPDHPIYRVGLRYAGEDPRVALQADAELSSEQRQGLIERLARFDKASPRGPWTADTLAIIERQPEVRAPDLAAELGYDTVTFKRNVRKLKELGLTESLPVGYRLSPRGQALRRPD